MKKFLRWLVLSGALALMAAPVFADGSGGPGGSNPPPTSGSGSGSTTPTATGNSSTTGSAATAGVIATLLSLLGL
jgi:hypothetical protein